MIFFLQIFLVKRYTQSFHFWKENLTQLAQFTDKITLCNYISCINTADYRFHRFNTSYGHANLQLFYRISMSLMIHLELYMALELLLTQLPRDL